MTSFNCILSECFVTLDFVSVNNTDSGMIGASSLTQRSANHVHRLEGLCVLCRPNELLTKSTYVNTNGLDGNNNNNNKKYHNCSHNATMDNQK